MRRAVLLTAGLLLIAAATVGLALGVQPRVHTSVGMPLRWSATAPDEAVDDTTFDAGARTLVLGHTAGRPTHPTLREGDRWLVFPVSFEGHDYDGQTRNEHQVVLVLESIVEGPGPTLELVTSNDDALSFVHLASVPKPSYQAIFEAVRVDGRRLEVLLTLDGDGFLDEAWWAPWHSVLARVMPRYSPELRAGTYLLLSKDGGETFTLHRR